MDEPKESLQTLLSSLPKIRGDVFAKIQRFKFLKREKQLFLVHKI